MSKLPIACLLLSLASCATHNHSHYGRSEWKMPDERPSAAPSEATAPTEIPVDVVRREARPFRGYRLFDERSFEEETFLTYLAAADVICFGEIHDSPLDHFAELRLLQGLADRRAIRGFELAVGFEMVRIAYQPMLRRYEDAPRPFSYLASKIHFDEEWGFPEPYYAPVFEFAAASSSRLLALGIAQKTTTHVRKTGIAGLSADQKSLLPELDLNNAEHRALFNASMEGHPGDDDMNLDHYYEAQVIWDEIMADRSTNFVLERWGARKLVIFAGWNHCHRSAIPGRILRRNPQISVVSVSSGESEPDEEGFDFSFVFEARNKDLD